jgi:hypothetical protein
MVEIRTQPRLRTLKGGRISFNHGAAIDCIVRNLTSTGACLEVASPIGIPESFELVLDSDGTSRACRVTWTSAKRIGVTFE